MAFCTIVEFEWNADFGRAGFEEMMTPRAQKLGFLGDC
jgi:hypothetical protein